jgi:hypothetical protein
MLNEDGHSLSYTLPDALPVETAAAGKEVYVFKWFWTNWIKN